MDDAFLVRDLGIDFDAVKSPLRASTKYTGERMVLMPSLVEPSLKRDEIIAWLTGIASKNGKFGVVSLVPSFKIADSWISLGASRTTVDNLEDKIKDLSENAKKNKAKEILLMVNQYDGVDLPDQTCRILCLDSLPSYTSLNEIYERQVRPNSTMIRRKMAQRVEQGIGRGIRGSDDWCIIIIAGNDLTDFLSEKSKRKYLSEEAQKQIEISEELANESQSESKVLKAMEDLIRPCLNRDDAWKSYYKQKMEEVETLPVVSDYLDIAFKERRAETLAQQGQERTAMGILDDLKSPLDKSENGWYLQLMATYLYPVNPTESMDCNLRLIRRTSVSLGLRSDLLILS